MKQLCLSCSCLSETEPCPATKYAHCVECGSHIFCTELRRLEFTSGKKLLQVQLLELSIFIVVGIDSIDRVAFLFCSPSLTRSDETFDYVIKTDVEIGELERMFELE